MWGTVSNFTHEELNSSKQIHFNQTVSLSNNELCRSTNMSMENLAYSMFMSFVLFFSMSGNSIVMLVVALSNSLRRKTTFYFVASLACSDLLVALFTVPFKISVKVHGSSFCLGLCACYVQILTDAFANVASILNLLLISVDRFVAIQLPYKYLELLSSRVSKHLLCSVWTLAAVWSFIGIYKWDGGLYEAKQQNGSNSSNIHLNVTHMSKQRVETSSVFSIQVSRMCNNTNTYYFLVSFYGIYIPVLLVMSCVYIKILHVAITQIRKIKQQGGVQGTIKPAVDVKPLVKTKEMERLNSASKSVGLKRHKWNLNKELQATKSVAIVYLAFCICWLPTCIITTIIHADKDYFHSLQKKNFRLFLTIYYVFVEILPLVNTMVNPIIYSFSNKQFRDGVASLRRKLLGKTVRRRSLFDLTTRRKASSAAAVNSKSRTNTII